MPLSTRLLAAHPTLLPLPANAQATEPVFADNSLASQLTGRLGALLTLAEQEQTTTVVDPALFDEVQALSRPHLVHQADGSLSEGSAAVQQLATVIKMDRIVKENLTNPVSSAIPMSVPSSPVFQRKKALRQQQEQRDGRGDV